MRQFLVDLAIGLAAGTLMSVALYLHYILEALF